MKIQEGELSFDFSGAQSVEKLDERGHKIPSGMMFVDFVIEEEERILIVEVKDPSANQISARHKGRVSAREIKKFRTDKLICDELVPKARDSYCYLHLMERGAKPFDYYFLTTIDSLGVNKELLINFNDRLKARLRKEADEEWKRQYVRNCAVLTMETWNSLLAPYRVERA